MDIQRMIGSALATLIAVAHKRFLSLLMPIGTTVVLMSSSPSCAVGTACVARFPLPFVTARYAAENATPPFSFGGKNVEGGVALLASPGNSGNVLRMAASSRVVGGFPEALAPIRTQRLFETPDAVCFSFDLSSAPRTRNRAPRCSGSDPTINRAVFLLRVILRRHERLGTARTGFFLSRASRFVGARDGAELGFSVNPLLGGLATSLARDCFHPVILLRKGVLSSVR